jgi:hypothetical protein
MVADTLSADSSMSRPDARCSAGAVRRTQGDNCESVTKAAGWVGGVGYGVGAPSAGIPPNRCSCQGAD